MVGSVAKRGSSQANDLERNPDQERLRATQTSRRGEARVRGGAGRTKPRGRRDNILWGRCALLVASEWLGQQTEQAGVTGPVCYLSAPRNTRRVRSVVMVGVGRVCEGQTAGSDPGRQCDGGGSGVRSEEELLLSSYFFIEKAQGSGPVSL